MLNKLLVGGSGLCFVAALALLMSAPATATPAAATATVEACQTCGGGTGCRCQYHPLQNDPACVSPKRICACFVFMGAPVVTDSVGPLVQGAKPMDGMFDGVTLRPAPATFPNAPVVLAQ